MVLSPIEQWRPLDYNDPYRVSRRRDEPIHSRSASDSSKRELIYEDAATDDDPYARNRIPNRLNNNNNRANSYLPYSHHRRNPLVAVPPIYIDNQGTPSFVAAPHDDQDRTISLQQVESSTTTCLSTLPHPSTAIASSTTATAAATSTDPSTLEKLPYRRRRRRPIRWRLWILLGILLAAIVAIVWYFCWPRVPSLSLTQIDNIDDFNIFDTIRGYYGANWTLTMTADNTANWIPTHLHALSVIVYDRNTQAQIGSGQTSSLTLGPRQKGIVSVPLKMAYYAPVNDMTYQDLLNACYIDERGQNSISTHKQDGLNLDFLVNIRIAGIAWSSTQNLSTPMGFSCPL